MKGGRLVSTGRSHNKKAKTYATTNKDRNLLSRKQSASSGSAKTITDFMKVSSKKPNSNNDKNTTVTNNINDPIKNITNNDNNIGSSITNIDLASASIELSATDLEMQEQCLQRNQIQITIKIPLSQITLTIQSKTLQIMTITLDLVLPISTWLQRQ